MIFRVDWTPPGSTQGDGRRTLAVVGHQAVGTRSSLWDKSIRQGCDGAVVRISTTMRCALRRRRHAGQLAGFIGRTSDIACAITCVGQHIASSSDRRYGRGTHRRRLARSV